MLLRPRLTAGQCVAFCETAKQAHVAAVCVPPTHVARASAVLVGSDVKLVALISHPFGTDLPSIKALAGRRALEDGAHELEIVVDLAAFSSGDPNHVRDELTRCIAEAREVRAEVLVRAVVETGVYDDRTLRLLVRAVVAAQVDMVVTSSGLVPEPDGTLDVELLREEVGAGVGAEQQPRHGRDDCVELLVKRTEHLVVEVHRDLDVLQAQGLPGVARVLQDDLYYCKMTSTTAE